VTFLHDYGLVAVLVALLLAPFGLPIPEDVTLLSAGALAWNGHAQLWAAYLVCWFGVVTGDTFLWTMGNRVGLHPKGFIGRRFGRRSIRRISRFYRRFGPWAIVICRNVPGTRFPAFFFAGATRMPLFKFIIFDGISACVTTLVLVSLGHAFGAEISRIATMVHEFRLIALAVVVATALGWFLWTRIRRKPDVVPEADDDGEITDAELTNPGRADSSVFTDGGPADRRM
jgi:membrane protein DedA with SNARE-associated domain